MSHNHTNVRSWQDQASAKAGGKPVSCCGRAKAAPHLRLKHCVFLKKPQPRRLTVPHLTVSEPQPDKATGPGWVPQLRTTFSPTFYYATKDDLEHQTVLSTQCWNRQAGAWETGEPLGDWCTPRGFCDFPSPCPLLPLEHCLCQQSQQAAWCCSILAVHKPDLLTCSWKHGHCSGRRGGPPPA